MWTEKDKMISKDSYKIGTFRCNFNELLDPEYFDVFKKNLIQFFLIVKVRNKRYNRENII